MRDGERITGRDPLLGEGTRDRGENRVSQNDQRTSTVVPAQLEDTLPVLESILLLVVRLDALWESRGESEEEVCEV